MTDCSVCLIEHDDAIHAATQRVHAYLRSRIALALAEMPVHATEEHRRPDLPRIQRPAVQPGPVRVKAKKPYAPRDPSKTPAERAKARNEAHYAAVKASTGREELRRIWRERDTRKRAAAREAGE